MRVVLAIAAFLWLAAGFSVMLEARTVFDTITTVILVSFGVLFIGIINAIGNR